MKNNVTQSEIVLDLATRLSFVLPEGAFQDTDVLFEGLRYTPTDCDDFSQPIPAWMTFYPDIGLLVLQEFNASSFSESGITDVPPQKAGALQASTKKADLRICINFNVSDTFETIQDQIIIIFRDLAPYLYQPILLISEVERQSLIVHVQEVVDFSFNQTTFWDDDNLLADGSPAGNMGALQYEAYQVGQAALPRWLQFNPTIRRFFGSPVQQDIFGNLEMCNQVRDNGTITDILGDVVSKIVCQIEILVTVSDGFFECNTSFVIEVHNTRPYSLGYMYTNSFNLSNPHAFYSHVDETVEIYLDRANFREEDRVDKILYSTRGLPSWMNFYGNILLIWGIPGRLQYIENECSRVELVPAYKTMGTISVTQQQCIIDIELGVSDSFNTSFYPFQIVIYNNIPYINNTISALERVHVDAELAYYIPQNMFGDIDEDAVLVQRVKMQDGNELPQWLFYNRLISKLSGVPKREDFFCQGNSQVRQVTDLDAHGQSHTVEQTYCQIIVYVSTSDGNNEMGQSMVIEVYNTNPF